MMIRQRCSQNKCSSESSFQCQARSHPQCSQWVFYSGWMTDLWMCVCVWDRDIHKRRRRKKFLSEKWGRYVMRKKELVVNVWSPLPCRWERTFVLLRPGCLVPLLCPRRSGEQQHDGSWRGSFWPRPDNVRINLSCSFKHYLLSSVRAHWATVETQTMLCRQERGKLKL